MELKLNLICTYSYRIYTNKYTNKLYQKAGTAGNLAKFTVMCGKFFIGTVHPYYFSEPVWLDYNTAHDLCYRV